jgi:hypothetical protein
MNALSLKTRDAVLGRLKKVMTKYVVMFPIPC